MEVSVRIWETSMSGDYGDVPGLEGECERCGNTIEVFGDSEDSERALCAKMREECPNHESNFYEPVRS